MKIKRQTSLTYEFSNSTKWNCLFSSLPKPKRENSARTATVVGVDASLTTLLFQDLYSVIAHENRPEKSGFTSERGYYLSSKVGYLILHVLLFEWICDAFAAAAALP